MSHAPLTSKNKKTSEVEDSIYKTAKENNELLWAEAEIEICLWLDHIRSLLLIRYLEGSTEKRVNHPLKHFLDVRFKRIDSAHGVGVEFKLPGKDNYRSFTSIRTGSDWLMSEIKTGLVDWTFE